MRVSDKQSLDGSLTGTGQAQPGTTVTLADRTGAAFDAMSKAALYVRISIPVSHQLAQVAAGRMDLHWQFDKVRALTLPRNTGNARKTEAVSPGQAAAPANHRPRPPRQPASRTRPLEY